MSSQLLPGHPVSVSMIANLKSRISLAYSIQVYYNVIAMSYYYMIHVQIHTVVSAKVRLSTHMVMGGGNSHVSLDDDDSIPLIARNSRGF